MGRAAVRRDLLRNNRPAYDPRGDRRDISFDHHVCRSPREVQVRRRRGGGSILALRRSRLDVRISAGLSDVRENLRNRMSAHAPTTTIEEAEHGTIKSFTVVWVLLLLFTGI